jgi:hypothetical protein
MIKQMLRNAEACVNERALTEGVDCGGATTERESARSKAGGGSGCLMMKIK